MNANLMHSARFGLAKHDAGLAVEAQLLEERAAIFAFGRHFADADFVAHHFDWLLALDQAAE